MAKGINPQGRGVGGQRPYLLNEVDLAKLDLDEEVRAAARNAARVWQEVFQNLDRIRDRKRTETKGGSI